MGIKQNTLWKDVFDRTLDEHLAPSLFEVVSEKAPKIYTNPQEFFKRTHLSTSMLTILHEITEALQGKGGRNVYPLFSLFGGGKTHTLVTIYHAFKTPNLIATKDKELATTITELTGKIKRTLILDCDSAELVPDPSTPLDAKGYRVRTIWGAMAHQLGRYDILRVRDETGVTPTPEEIKNLLGNQPTLILIDEIVKRIHTLRGSLASELRGYAQNMITFIENLAKGVVGTQTVVLITLPIDFKLTKDEKNGLEKEEYAYEEAYKDEAIIAHRAIGRIVSKIDVPLTVGDVVEVLKKRTFEKTDSSEAVETQRKYISTYSENPEIFERQTVTEALKIADYYPYHPSYISTLYEIVTRSPELQRTRDALRITREVTRVLWRSGEDPELIMPWHIDLASPNIRGRLITATYRGYNAALNKDIVTERGEKGRVSLASKPELAYAAATTIFLETFTYGDVLIAAPPFPTKEDIAFMVYEKASFEKHDYKLTDIIDTLEEMRNTLIHLQERDNKYWFTTFPSVIDAIERKAREIANREAYPELKGLVKKILIADIDIVAGARRARRREEEFRPKIYLENLCVITTPEEQPITKGIQNYTLLVLLRKPSDEDLSEIIFTEDGRTRTYRNAVTILHPSDETLVNSLLTEVKKYKAATKIIEEELDQLYLDETIKEIQKKRADNYIRIKYGEILRRSLSALDTVAYPKYDSDKKMDAVGVSKVSPSRSVISQAELTLQDRSIAKIPPDYRMTFDGLNFLLGERLGINLKEGDREISVSDLLGYFLTNPKLPIVTFDMLKPALREGVRNLDIAMRSVKEGRIYWKKIYKGEEKPSGIEQGDEPTFIDHGDTVIPWSIVAKEFTEGLLKKEGIFEEEGVKKRVWHVVLIEGVERRLSDLVKQSGFEDLLRTCPIVERLETIREEFDVTISPEYMCARPSENVEVSVEVEPIGVFNYSVGLKVDKGEISPEKEKPSFLAEWRLTTPKSAQLYEFTLTALAEDPKKTKITRTLKVEVLKEVTVDIVERLENNHIGRLIVKIETENYNSFTNLMSTVEPKLRGKTTPVDGNAKIFSATSNIEFNAQSTDQTIFKHLIQEALDTMGGKVRDFAASTRIEEGLQVDEVLVIACRDIKNVKYHLLR